MSKYKVMMFASYLQLRVYILGVLVLIAASMMADFIIGASIGFENYTYISLSNMLTLTLLFVGGVLPVALFRKMINLGTTRREYYVYLVLTYVSYAAGFALLNGLWLMMEVGVLRNFFDNFNLIEIFHWDQYGWFGMVFYQFAIYMLILSLLNLLFSGFYSLAGWVVWFVLITAIPIGVAVPMLRPKVAEGLASLLMNESMLNGLILILSTSLFLLLAGWWFVKRRPV